MLYRIAIVDVDVFLLRGGCGAVEVHSEVHQSAAIRLDFDYLIFYFEKGRLSFDLDGLTFGVGIRVHQPLLDHRVVIR